MDQRTGEKDQAVLRLFSFVLFLFVYVYVWDMCAK